MMSGVQEILVLAVIVLIIFYLPRLRSKESAKKVGPPLPPLSGRLRAAIAASAFWPLAAAAFLKPWRGEFWTFFYIGICPVLAAWAAAWVLTGYKKNRR